MEGWIFRIVNTETGEIVWEACYPDEYLEDAMAAFIDQVGGIELGTKLEIEEVGA